MSGYNIRSIDQDVDDVVGHRPCHESRDICNGHGSCGSGCGLDDAKLKSTIVHQLCPVVPDNSVSLNAISVSEPHIETWTTESGLGECAFPTEHTDLISSCECRVCGGVVETDADVNLSDASDNIDSSLGDSIEIVGSLKATGGGDHRCLSRREDEV